MISFIKSVIKACIPLGLYLGMFLASLAGAFGRPIIPLLVIAFITPLPNVWYQIHQFPMGKDAIDILLFGAMIGLVTGKHMKVRARSGILLILYTLATYGAVWHSAMRFELPLPITPANEVFVNWKNYVEMIILYFITFHCAHDEKRQRQIIMLCMIVFFVIVLRDMRNFAESAGGFSYDKRSMGPFWMVGLGPNHFGAFVVHFAAVSLGLTLVVKNKKLKWFFLATSIISVQPLFFTYSRGAYLAALAVLAVFAALRKPMLFILLGVLAVSWQTILPRTVVERVTMTESSEGQLESSAADRVVLWDHALSLFQGSPVVGVGYGGFALSKAGGKYTSVHNLYLETLAEQGIFGVSFLILIMFVAAFSGFLLFLRAKNDFDKGLGLGFLGCCIACMITNIFGDRWSYFSMGAYYFIIWGVVDRILKNIALEAEEKKALAKAERAGKWMAAPSPAVPAAGASAALASPARVASHDAGK